MMSHDAVSISNTENGNAMLVQFMGWSWSVIHIGQTGLTILSAMGPIILGLAALIQASIGVVRLRFEAQDRGERAKK